MEEVALHQQQTNVKALKPDWFIIGWMVVAHVAALVSLPFVSLTGFVVFAILYFVTACLGVTLGYHRLLSHRSFKVPKILERFFAICGVLSLQGSPLEWIGHHRMHHAFGDSPRDPHNAREGFWYCHMGWLFKINPLVDELSTLKRFGRDMTADKFMVFLSRPAVQIGLQAALGLALWSMFGFWVMMWGIFVRVVAVYHATWLVNSAAHTWGYATYPLQNDSSRNNWFVALMTFGEGWHNNHHAHPDVAPAGHKWWEFDVTWGVIRLLRALGLASAIKMPEVVPAEAKPTLPSASNPSNVVSGVGTSLDGLIERGLEKLVNEPVQVPVKNLVGRA